MPPVIIVLALEKIEVIGPATLPITLLLLELKFLDVRAIAINEIAQAGVAGAV